MIEETRLNHLTPQQADEMMREDSRVVFVDIRSNMEFLFVGHPKGAVHVPWIDEPDWTVNPHFVRDIRQLLLGGVCDQDEGCPAVILICRSGKRSREAGDALIAAGIQNVCHIDEGFEGELDDKHRRSTIGGWRYHGLPWEQC